MRRTLFLAALCALSACATAQMHDQVALDQVALGCGMTYGNLIQDDEQRRILIALRNDPRPAMRACVADWGRRHHLKTVFVQMDAAS